ncbi:Putative amino acid/polyamine transporter I [Septoria linicola]|uniref:Amino acid/polyamine transporter I n=1 Tax=Septoria linicola TaxID=215465 RepID=A0A9Q9B0J7_9PEZI|nr:Putative amino acid/polyamine transporter I [Septoria linicola]
MSEQITTRETTDIAALALLGKKQVLQRRFNFYTLLGFAICELITWETVLALFSQAFNNGGPAGAVYGFIIAWFSTMSVYTVVSEMASLAPIAGGQYYWVYMLAPNDWKVVSSYIVGWLTTLAWIATVATETLFAGTIIQGVLVLDYPDYASEPWQGMLLTWAVILACVFMNVVLPRLLPKFNFAVMIIHLCGFVAVLVTLWVMTPSLRSNEFVWKTSMNEGGWPTQSLSYCVGFLGNVATFVGADASVHMAEEVSNAAINIPKAILSAMIVNGAVGFVMLVTILYCLGDTDSVLNTPTGFPFIQVFQNSVQDIAGATAMTALVTFLTWACANGITTTASRMAWSFARDRGLPLSPTLSRISAKSKIPWVAVLSVAFIAALLTIIYAGSETAFNDVVSLTITGFYGSYMFPSSLLLWRRITGQIEPHGSIADDLSSSSARDLIGGRDSKSPTNSDESTDGAGIVIVQNRLVWGPWHLPGWLGIVNNIYACCYMTFVIFWSVWPPDYHVTAETMNYSIVITGGVMILSAVWYYLYAKKIYKGPLIDDEIAAVMRAGSVVAAN